MCLGIPMQVSQVQAQVAICCDGERQQCVDISLIDEPAVGDWLLVHLGSARQMLTEHEARQIRLALDAVNLVMQTGAGQSAAIDRLFADLVDREPPLPPHLQAASDVQTTTHLKESE